MKQYVVDAFTDKVFKGNPVPFVMELPNYRMPGMGQPSLGTAWKLCLCSNYRLLI